MEKICAYCEKAFEAKGRARFCSDSHRIMGYRKKKGLPVTPFGNDQISSGEVEKLRKEISDLVKERQSYQDSFKQTKALLKKAENDYKQGLDAINEIILLYYLNPNQGPEVTDLVKAHLINSGKLS